MIATLSPQPIVLSAAPVPYLTTDAVGTEKSANQGVWNSEPTGVLISDIFIQGNAALAEAGGGNANTGVGILLRYRGEPITNGYLPFSSVCSVLNAAFEDPGGVVGGITILRLAKPFYLEPGGIIDVAYSSIMFQANVTLRAFAVGIQALTPPKERWLPYLTSYLGPTYIGTSNAVIENQSVPTDLGNPFGDPIFVDQLIGRVYVGIDPNNGVAPTNFRDTGSPSAAYAFRTRLTDHKGAAWIPVPTPIPLAFDTVTRAWPVKTNMDAKGFLTADLSGVATFTSVTPGFVLYARAGIGLVGYRRIG
jgi:hypothetical protein